MTAAADRGSALVDGYDAALFDLDGVVYLGPVAVDGAAEGIAGLRERGARVGFVTNNAARSPGVVAAHLIELGIQADAADVVTAAQAAADLVAQRFGPGTTVLIVGGEGVRAAVAEAGLVGVDSAEDHPTAVIQGYAVDLTWDHLIEAAVAVQRGAHWVATNTDPTRPTDRGLVPGNGAAVAAVRMAVSVDPEVAGKPYRPLLDDTVSRLQARHPIFVGDRLDTDIAGAVNAGLDSLFVLSGSHGPHDLLSAGPGSRPTHLGWDLRALLHPARVLTRVDAVLHCGGTSARVVDGHVHLGGQAPAYVDALWLVAHLAWEATDAHRPLDHDRALEALSRLE